MVHSKVGQGICRLSSRAHLHELQHTISYVEKNDPLSRTRVTSQDDLGIKHPSIEFNRILYTSTPNAYMLDCV